MDLGSQKDIDNFISLITLLSCSTIAQHKLFYFKNLSYLKVHTYILGNK